MSTQEDGQLLDAVELLCRHSLHTSERSALIRGVVRSYVADRYVNLRRTTDVSRRISEHCYSLIRQIELRGLV